MYTYYINIFCNVIFCPHIPILPLIFVLGALSISKRFGGHVTIFPINVSENASSMSD